MATDEEELLTAFVDDVGALTPAERRRVEQRLASDPALRRDADEIRAVLERARELPPASEPDWSALEQQIQKAVGPDVPLPWWRRARWVAPISTLVTTAAIALLWLHHRGPEPAPTSHDTMLVAAPVATPERAAPAPPPTAAIYIDGQVIDISNLDPETLIDSDDTGDAGDAAADNALLPAADYGWVDGLDDNAMDRAERWLARKKG